MKQKKRVSIIGTLILIISAVALITGCLQPNGGTITKNIVEFDSARVTCKKTNSYPYTNINTGDPIKENDELKFQAILPAGKIVKNWYINDVKQEDKTDSLMSYTVKASDIAGGRLKVRFDTKDPVQKTIEFDSSVTCQNTNSYPYTNINTGAPIQENDKLRFEAILPPGKIVKNWYINDVKKKYETYSWMSYTVKASDFVSGKLKVRFDTKDPEQGTIEFDASVTCQNTNTDPYTNINTGAQIQENDKLQFEAILPAGKIVENWYINDVKKKYETDSWMRYTVKASDFADGKIKVRFDTKDPEQGTIEFDSTRVKCQNINSSPYTDINNGAPIQENDKLQFEAILPPGKIVENWYINDVKKEYETDSWMRYTVKASDFKSGKIKISVVFK